MFIGGTVRMCARWQKNKRKVIQTIRRCGVPTGIPAIVESGGNIAPWQ